MQIDMSEGSGRFPAFHNRGKKAKRSVFLVFYTSFERARSTMKCPKCATMCMTGDTVCFGCKRPIGAQWTPTGGGDANGRRSGKPTVAQCIAMLFMVLGAAIMPVAMGRQSWAQKEEIDFLAANWAGIGAVIGVTFGLIVGKMFEGKKL